MDTDFDQYRLFGEAPLPVSANAKQRAWKTREEQFIAYDAERPEVYRAFKRVARSFLRKQQQMGAVAILSLIRRGAGRGVTNSFAPYYSRKAVKDDPRLADVLIIRTLCTTAPLSERFFRLPSRSA